MSAGVFLVGVYGGYFGAAAGVMLLALLLLGTTEPLPTSNALKNALLGLANAVAALGFALLAPVEWLAIVPLATGLFAGARLGPVVVRHAPAAPAHADRRGRDRARDRARRGRLLTEHRCPHTSVAGAVSLGMTSFVITPLPAGEVDTEAPVAHRTLSDGRAPCRRCLRNAEAGEALVLTPYDPFTVRSPYAGEGPVFVHADGCEPFAPAPGQLCRADRRRAAAGAYDGEAMMTGAAVLAGEGFEERVTELLGADRVKFLHVHFAGPGCFAFRVDPPPETTVNCGWVRVVAPHRRISARQGAPPLGVQQRDEPAERVVDLGLGDHQRRQEAQRASGRWR